MVWYEDFIQAFEELAGHKLRTLLTLLGMIFGVGAVIAMLSVGEGAEREALKAIDTMGIRNILVKVKPRPEELLPEIREDSLGLSLRDLKAAGDTLPFLKNSTALKRVRTYNLFSQYAKSDAAVIGVSASFFQARALKLREGRTLIALDDQFQAQYCVLGSRAAHDLFGTQTALGGQVKINHLWFTVVGILEGQHVDQGEFQGVKLNNSDNSIYLPIQTTLKKFAFKPLEEELDELHVQVDQGVEIHAAALSLSRLLETRHRGVDDFELVVPEALLKQHRETQRIFNIVMSAIAGISLLVGGIGIMNIMLANILERTREIGIRRAIGAKQQDILRLFMIEAFTIAFIGGLLGIVLGFGIAKTIAVYSGWTTAWSLSAVFLAVGFCAATGLIFGIVPAVKAAALSPIEALRHD